MKKLLLFSLVFPVFFLAGCTGKQGTGDNNQASTNGTGETAETVATTTAETTSLVMVDKEKFRLQVPANWAEDPTLFVPWDTSSDGTVSWGDKSEQTEGEFETRMTVSYQYLGNQTFASRMEEVQEKIKTIYPDAVFADRYPATGHPGRVCEGNYKKDGVSYRIFIFLLAGNDVAESGKVKDAYMVSFQTVWRNDVVAKMEGFYKIIDSFEVK